MVDSHNYKFICQACDSTLEGDFRYMQDQDLKCLGCGKTLKMIYHMFPNGDYWITPEYMDGSDD
jgi:hypothetical protein